MKALDAPSICFAPDYRQRLRTFIDQFFPKTIKLAILVQNQLETLSYENVVK